MNLICSKNLKGIDYILLRKQLLVQKLVILLFAMIFIIIYSFSFSLQSEYLPFINYFNSFSSPEVIEEIELELELEEGMKVVSYNSRYDIFIISQNLYDGYNEFLEDFYSEEEILSGDTFLYGIASREEILVEPAYLSVLSISGDYAIVIKPFFPSINSVLEDMEMKIGVVKFRGEDAGDRTDFSTDYLSIADQLLMTSQMQFIGDKYIAVQNDLDNIDITTNVVTFYDYRSSHKLLEAFRVRADSNYKFLLADNTIVAMTNTKAEFYRITQIDEKGFLIAHDVYNPFPEDKGETLAEYMTTTVSYLGNNWFFRQGYIKLDKEEDDDSVSVEDLQSIEGKVISVDGEISMLGEPKKYYLLMRSDRYNASSGISLKDEKLMPDMIVNKYNKDGTRDIADYLNNQMVEDWGENMFAYDPPSIPVGELPKDDMSIVYYYWFPYDNRPDKYEISFFMMDNHGNIFHPKENIYMPLFMVDDYAVQIADPDYELPRGDVKLLNNKNIEKVFKEESEDFWYVNIAYANDILIVREESRRVGGDELYGAFNKDGQQITQFKYLELSLFYGDYAIGMNKVGDDFYYYRIDKDGQEEKLNDVMAIRNGVYVSLQNNRAGLKTYDGTVLLENEFETIDVLEAFLVNGEFQESIVIAQKNNKTYIYTLK